MSSNALDRFRKIAVELYDEESKYRPAMRRAAKLFRAECLAVLESAAREAAAPLKGRRYGSLKGKRVPVAQMARSKAKAALDGWLKMRNIPRRQYGVSDEVAESGNMQTAVPLNGFSWGGGGEYESGKSTVNRTEKSGRRNLPNPAVGQASKDMARPADRGVRMDGRNFAHGPTVLSAGTGYRLIVPRMPWPQLQEVTRPWRHAYTISGSSGDLTSLLNPVGPVLLEWPGTVLILVGRLGGFVKSRVATVARYNGRMFKTSARSLLHEFDNI